MQLTQSDASAVHSTGKQIRGLERNVITDEELVNALFCNLSVCDTDDGILQCVALMPRRLWPLITEKLDDIGGHPHPGRLFVFVPFAPTDEELEHFDRRVRHAISIVADYLQNPTGKVEFEIDDPDGMRQRWFVFKHFQTVAGEKCRKFNCGDDRVQDAVFCAAHHFEMIYGQPPPA